MKEPQYSNYFPLSEYEQRISNLRKEMKAEGMDAALLSTQADVTYFTGSLNGYWICTMHDDVQLVLITADQAHEPVLMFPDHLMDVAQTSCISDMRGWSQFSGGKSQGPVQAIADTFADLKISNGRVGLSIGPHDRIGMSPCFLDELKGALPGVDWPGCFDVIQRIQAVKSPLEAQKVRFACKTSCQAIEVGLNAIKEGMSEKELAQVIVSEITKLSPDVGVNHPWFMFIYATGRGACAFDGVPSDYRFKKGDGIYIDGGHIYQGYRSDMIRCACIGEPSRDQEKYYYAARDANMKAIEQIRPGIKGKELYGLWVDALDELGMKWTSDQQLECDFDMIGHGLGMTTHELPLISSKCEMILQPGMVMAIEGNVFDDFPFSKTRHALKNEENVLVTEDGYEWLTPLNNDLYIIG